MKLSPRKFASDAIRALILLAATPWMALAAKPEQPAPNAAPNAQMALGVTLAEDGAPGIRVVSVQPDSPASKAHLHAGDRLLAVNGRPVTTAADVLGIVRGGKPGDRYKLRLEREGFAGNLWIVPEIGRPGLRDQIARGAAAGSRRGAPAALGVTLYDGPYTGVRVLTVQANSPAASAGLRVGDHILSIDGEEVADSGALIAFIADSHPGDAIRLRINRDGLEGTITAVLGERDAVFGRPTAPVRYRGPAEEADRFYQPATPGQINDQRSYGG